MIARDGHACAHADRELIGLHVALLQPRAVLRFLDTLDAEGALLHHALAAHRDVGVELPVERLGERILVRFVSP